MEDYERIEDDEAPTPTGEAPCDTCEHCGTCREDVRVAPPFPTGTACHQFYNWLEKGKIVQWLDRTPSQHWYTRLFPLTDGR